MTTQNDHDADLRQLLTGFIQEQRQHNSQTTAAIADLQAGQARLEDNQTNLAENQARLEANQARLETKVDAIADDVGILKGFHIRELAMQHAGVILQQFRPDIRFRNYNVIPQDEVRSMASRLTDPSASERLANTDFVIAAYDPNRTLHYVAVETAFQVDHEDVTRAIRSAGHIHALTGCPSHPAVSGYELLSSANQAIHQSNGRVKWHRISSKARNPR